MVKCIMVPKTVSPHNLKRIHPYYPRKPADQSEDDFIASVVSRNQEVGVVPYETDEARTAHIAALDARDAALIASWDARDAALTEAGQPVPERESVPERATFPAAGPHYIVEESALPGGSVSEENDYFFDCWEWSDAVVVNMTKARALHMDVIRKARDIELVKLDVPWMKAVEAGNTSDQATIAARKQTLRDIPATFDITTGVDTPEKLKAKWPTELPARE
jgi:hypothetical protein